MAVFFEGSGCNNLMITEPYAKVPAGAGGGGIAGRLTDAACCWLEEAEGELRVS